MNCQDIRTRYPECDDCCTSCHDDDEAGFDDLYKGNGLHVCCTVLLWMKENGKVAEFPE